MSSRVAKKPIPVPNGVDVKIEASQVIVKGPEGELNFPIRSGVKVNFADHTLTVQPTSQAQQAYAYAGTVRAILNNNVQGVTQGFEKKLLLVGVGYRAQAGQVSGRYKLSLTLGLSHPVEYIAPKGITFETPTQTEILIKGIDKHLVGQIAADVRSINKRTREPEPYKGKGIRYHDEKIILKETKKK